MKYLTVVGLFNLLALVSGKKSSTVIANSESDFLKAVVYNLPEACKQLNTMGTFDALTAKKYECMFSETINFEPKKPATILAVLMQKGEKELVGAIAKIWVEKRQWGPFNQDEIASDLKAVLSVKPLADVSKKAGIKIEDEVISKVYKTMLTAGSGLIATNAVHSRVISRVLKLAFKIDKSKSDYAKTLVLIMETFFVQSLPKKNSSSKDFDFRILSQVYSMTRVMNRLAAETKIKREIWNVYAPVLCSELNSRFGIKFVMTEKQKKESKLRSSSLSDNEDDESIESSENQEDIGVELTDKASTEPLKYIELCEKNANETSQAIIKQNSGKARELRCDEGEEDKLPTETSQTNMLTMLAAIGGSVLLIVSLCYVVYVFLNKKRLSKSSADLS